MTLNSVDEDIFEMGERKSRLTDAVLNDKQSSGTKKQKKDDDNADINSIGKILQKALQQHISKEKSDAITTATTTNINHARTEDFTESGAKKDAVSIEKTKMNTAEVINLISPLDRTFTS